MKGFVRQAVWVLSRSPFTHPPPIWKERSFIKYIYQSSKSRSGKNFDLLSLIRRKWLLRTWRQAKPEAADLSSTPRQSLSLSLSFGGCGSISNGGWLFWLMVVGWFWLKVVGWSGCGCEIWDGLKSGYGLWVVGVRFVAMDRSHQRRRWYWLWWLMLWCFFFFFFFFFFV